ncbi:DUF4360 domain-containing protein [Allokutzneria multivorans]|uniref:DUF4360 domain-containing protein n=1 Tax=Allokutzneria multivorans TaxID=1142134 RepID=A0ABP7TT36_9PSEU
MLRTATVAGVLLSLLAVPSPALADDSPPPPGKITVDVVSVNGSGCPAGTAAVAVNHDNTAFTVTYSRYLAQAGGGADPTEIRKNCQLNLRVNVPQGFTYAVAQADYRGYANLASGASGIEQANYYFTGTSPTAHVRHTFRGPFNDNWQATDKTAIADLVYAPCGEQRNLNVNSELRVSKGSSTGHSFMSMDSTDGSVNTIYHFAWKKCDQ